MQGWRIATYHPCTIFYFISQIWKPKHENCVMHIIWLYLSLELLRRCDVKTNLGSSVIILINYEMIKHLEKLNTRQLWIAPLNNCKGFKKSDTNTGMIQCSLKGLWKKYDWSMWWHFNTARFQVNISCLWVEMWNIVHSILMWDANNKAPNTGWGWICSFMGL